LEKLIDDLGGWPVTKNDNHVSPYTWQEVVERAIQIGFSIDFPVTILTVPNFSANSSQMIIEIAPPDLSLASGILLQKVKNITLQSYHQQQVDMAVRFGADREKAEIEMLEVMEFEISLANVRNEAEQFV
jgi:Peptidase family M13